MSGTVYVVDDDEAVRRSLDDILCAEGLAVRAFDSAEALLSACDAQSEGCIVLDIRLPGMDGMQTQAKLTERGVEMPIIFLTGHGEVQMSVRAMKAGAYDFLQKPVPADILLGRVNNALLLDRRRHERRTEITTARELLARLSSREQEVFNHLLQGASSKEIAKQLGLSPRTVDVHRQNILIKCRVSSLLELSHLHHLCNGD
jgi:RNA polymerase sigma factor (sigma-70 family)